MLNGQIINLPFFIDHAKRKMLWPAENDYQTSGEVRDSQIARLGQKFGVRYVVVADVSELSFHIVTTLISCLVNDTQHY